MKQFCRKSLDGEGPQNHAVASPITLICEEACQGRSTVQPEEALVRRQTKRIGLTSSNFDRFAVISLSSDLIVNASLPCPASERGLGATNIHV